MSTPSEVGAPGDRTRLRPGGRYGQWHGTPPRYVLCDVDGTLVDASGTVHDQVRTAAIRALECGIHVGFATGRGAGGLGRLQAELNLPGPHVIANGGQVRFEGRAVHTLPVAAEVVAAVLAMPGVYAEFYTDEGYWATDLREEARPHWDLLGTEPLGAAAAANLAEVSKITVVLFGDDGDDEVLAGLRSLPVTVGEGTSPATPGLEYINITHPAADKGSALRAAAAVVDVDIAATAAVGDERNDLPMLRVAGTAVAMGQSGRETIAAAHLVGPPVEQQGLASVLDTLVRWTVDGVRPEI